MSIKTGCWFAAVALILSVVQPVTGELTDAQVRNAIERGSSFLKTEQKSDGHWTEHSIYVGGVTALTTLALLNSGEDVKSPVIQRALAYLRSLGEPSTVYATSLQTMAMCAAEPAKDAAIIGRNVKWLEAVQLRSGLRKGAWNYADKKGSGDNSNTQFALLALHEAHRIGIEVKRDTWELALDYWLRTQREDGSWGYTESEPATGSMTCAGIGCVVICQSKIGSGDARLIGSSVECCGTQTDDDAIERAMQWLTRHFSTN
ncbi:MAG: terpene cyclase/mutase family protein, partial [Planctomycetales bacterium]|nr:terpene cyclase/mutase family protein [Planctomycetales bacterium]